MRQYWNYEERPLAGRQAKKKIPKAAEEETQIKFDLDGETFLWGGKYYVNIKTGMIAPTRIHQKLDHIRLEDESE